VQLKFDTIGSNFGLFVAAHEFVRLSAAVTKSIFLRYTAAALPKDRMTPEEIPVDPCRRVEVDGDFYGENPVRPAVSQYSFDLIATKACLVIRHHRDLPRLEPTFLPTVLPIDLCVVREAFVLTTSRIRGYRCLASHEAIPYDLVPFERWGLSPPPCPRQNLDAVEPYYDAALDHD
jgi:hypothetical protein